MEAVAAVFASFFGAGLVLRQLRGQDGGSGTVGALIAGLLAYLLSPVWGRTLALMLTVLLGLWATSRLGFAHDDPAWVVIDEAAGMFLASVGLGPLGLVVAFAVFRLADIFKRAFPGVAAAEAVGGPFGIMGDDLVAALYGLTAGWIVQALTS